VNSAGALLSFGVSDIFQSKSAAIFKSFSFGSRAKSLVACFASARAYLFFTNEFSVAIMINSAKGKEEISTPMF